MIPSYTSAAYKKMGNSPKKGASPSSQFMSSSQVNTSSEGGGGGGGGRIEGPSITLGGDEDDFFEKFKKEQMDIRNMQEMQSIRAMDKAMSDPNYLRNMEQNLRKQRGQNEYTIRENLKSASAWANARKNAQEALRGRQGHSSPTNSGQQSSGRQTVERRVSERQAPVERRTAERRFS